MSHRAAPKNTNLLKMLLVTTAAMLAICLLALVETKNKAEATALPDNGKIAFVSNRDGDNEIFKMTSDGTVITQLTNNTKNDRYPVWSPDGSKIAFVRELPRRTKLFLNPV